MTAVISAIQPGEVWAVNTGNALTSELIRIGETLEGEPGLANHVVGVHHRDKRGVWWGIEGRPGGVGWTDLARYQREPLVRLGNSNASQVLTDAQRSAICQLMVSVLGTGYDWIGGIDADVANALDLHALAGFIDGLWGNKPGEAPGHLVCSSTYAYIYAQLGLANPAGPSAAPAAIEQVDPAAWWAFNAALNA